MSFRFAILGPLLICATGLTAQAQNAQFYQPPSSVGNLQTPGVVGRSDPMQYLGRVGGFTTGRLDPYSTLPRNSGGLIGGPGAGFNPQSRPRGLLDTAAGIPGYRGGSSRIPSSFEFRHRGFNSRSTFDNNRNQSYATRHQLVRNLIGSSAVRSTGVLADYETVLASRNQFKTPIERLHGRSNLLRPKSLLGQIVATPDLALYDAAPIAPTRELTPSVNPLSIMPDEEGASLRAFDDEMAIRLKKKYEEFKAEGLSYFRQRNYVGARDRFETCRGLERGNPWPYAIDTLVALESGELSRASNSLIAAIDRAKSLDELTLHVKDLYVSPLDFEKTLNIASNQASLDGDGQVKLGNLLLSYCAWLKGDLPTAVSAAQLAAKSMQGEGGESVQRYADQLKQSASQPPDTPN